MEGGDGGLGIGDEVGVGSGCLRGSCSLFLYFFSIDFISTIFDTISCFSCGGVLGMM